jgi:hypothetical protein
MRLGLSSWPLVPAEGRALQQAQLQEEEGEGGSEFDY